MRNRITVAALMAGLTLGLAAQAAEPQSPAVTETTYAGLTVGIDPVTGKLRPLTAAESKRLSTAILGKARGAGQPNQPRNAQEARATKRVHANGSVSVRVPVDQMSQIEARIGDDGKVTMYEGSAPVARKEEIK